MNTPTISSIGTKEWWRDGKLHREGGPAVIEKSGSEFWFINGLLHRTDGPAFNLYTGTKSWWFEGKQHRAYGPAVIWAAGVPELTQEWWYNGVQYKNNTHPFLQLLIANNLYSKWQRNELTEEEMVLIRLSI